MGAGLDGAPRGGRVAGLLPGAYLATVGVEPVWVRLLIGLVYAYAVVLAFWALGMASTWGPLALALVFTAVTVWRIAVLGDLSAALLWLPIFFLVNLPLMTAVWVYLALLLGLNRLGREPCR